MSSASLASGFSRFGQGLVLVFGLLPAGLMAIGAIFLLPNMDMLQSDAEMPIALSVSIRHYLTFSAPVLGFAAMLFAYVAPAPERERFRFALIPGIGIGLLAAAIAFVSLTGELWFFLGHWIRGTRLPFDFVEKRLLGTLLWFVVFGGMIAVGLELLRRTITVSTQACDS